MRNVTIILTLFLSLIFTIQLNAQTDYPIKNVGGTDYFVYTVQKSEGLYSISRRFDVTQSEINTLNPEIQTGLQVGQQILIPISASMKQRIIHTTKTSETTQQPQIERQDYILHEVLRRQTLFAISKLYDVDQDDIIALNPGIENKRLRTGVVLRIPQKKKSAQPSTEKTSDIGSTTTSNTQSSSKELANSSQATDGQYLTHTVKAGDTFYSLSKLYKTTIDDIAKLNNINDGNLRMGAELRIPITEKNIAESVNDLVGNAMNRTTKMASIVDASQLDNYIGLSDNLKPNKKPIRIAFLLPFMLDAGRKTASIERFEDFYAGALLAIEQAKSKGISFEILSLDTENTDNGIISVLENENLKKMDLIIGPAYSNQIRYISEFARKNKIHTLIPFSSNVTDVQTNKYLFQFNPDINVQANFLKNILVDKFREQDIIFIHLEGVNFNDGGNELSAALQNLLDAQKRSYKLIKLSKDNHVGLSNAINQNKKNIIFFNTDKYSLVNPYLSILESVNSNNSILLFEQYAWIPNNIDQVPTFSISPFKSNENNAKYNNYKAHFNKYFNWNVSKQQPHFDILGYDLSTYFISMLYTYDAKFTVDPFTHLLPQSKGIQSDLMFFKFNTESGFKNHTLYLNEKSSSK